MTLSVTPPSHLVQVLLSRAAQLPPVLVPQLFQLPLVVVLHFLAQLLEDVGELPAGNKGWRARSMIKGAGRVPARVHERINLQFFREKCA